MTTCSKASDVTLALVDERCGGDAELRQEVLRLLSADRRAGDFLSEPAVAFAVSIADAIDDVEQLDDPPAPEIVGPWRILREIGRGGMGVVYLAERTGEQFRQLAALKLVRAGVGERGDPGAFSSRAANPGQTESPAVSPDCSTAAGRRMVVHTWRWSTSKVRRSRHTATTAAWMWWTGCDCS